MQSIGFECEQNMRRSAFMYHSYPTFDQIDAENIF